MVLGFGPALMSACCRVEWGAAAQPAPGKGLLGVTFPCGKSPPVYDVKRVSVVVSQPVSGLAPRLSAAAAAVRTGRPRMRCHGGFPQAVRARGAPRARCAAAGRPAAGHVHSTGAVLTAHSDPRMRGRLGGASVPRGCPPRPAEPPIGRGAPGAWSQRDLSVCAPRCAVVGRLRIAGSDRPRSAPFGSAER